MHISSREYPQILFLILLFLSSSNLPLVAQKIGLPEIEYFNRRQYGAGTQNWKITQNQHDLIYFANNDGVVEHDGVNWKLHREDSPFVVRCVHAVEERIYAGLYNQLGYYEYDSLHHLVYHSLLIDPSLKNNGDYWNIHEWNNNVVFQSESNICLFEHDQLKVSIPATSRFTASFLVNGLLLVHEETEGLMEIRGNTAYPISGGNIFSDKMITSMMPLSDNEILIGTMRQGLYIWNMHSIKPWQVEANSLLKESNIFCGTNYRNDYLIFGTIQSGFVITDKAGKVIMHVDKDKGLVNNTVLSVFVDKEGNIWGGLDNGIVRLSFNSSITFLQGYYDIGTGYVMKKLGDRYLLGTNQALFQIDEGKLFDPLKKRKDFKRIKGTDGQVWSLYEIDGQILCGHNLGVYSINSNSSKLLTPPTIKGAWIFREINNRPDLMMVGTYSGLVILEKRNGRWAYRNKIEGFDESSRYIEWDEDGSLWMSNGYSGIYKLSFDPNYKRVTSAVNMDFDNFEGNSADLVLTKIEDKCMLVGSDGFFAYDPDSKSFKPYTQWDQFFDAGNFPKLAYDDEYDNIWYFHSGRVGVLRLMEDASYKKIDYPFKPLQNKLVNSFESVAVTDGDNVFFGIEDGFAHYSARESRNYRKPFLVNVRSFSGKSDSVPFVFNQYSDKRVEQISIPTYEFKDNSFEIQFAAAYYEDDDLEYSTFLKGVDTNKDIWSDRTMREFTELKEGDYEFVIKARNRYGVQSRPLSFRFKIMPPWHRSNYARMVYVLLIIVITFLVFSIFNRRLEVSRTKEKLRQRAHYKEKEEVLTKEALRAEKEMIRMRNEKLRNEMVFKEKELANSTMNIIRKNEFLGLLKGQLKKLKSVNDKAELEAKLQSMIKRIDKDIDSESYWEVFEMHLEQVHESFLNRLKDIHPDLTPRELKLVAYIRMGMSSKEIATLMNISSRAVENNRYKLRQKLNIEQGENLGRYITNL